MPDDVVALFRALEQKALKASQEDRRQAWEALQALSPDVALAITKIAAIFGRPAKIHVTVLPDQTWQWPPPRNEQRV